MGQQHSSSFFLTVFALGCSAVHSSSVPGAQRSGTTDSIAFEVTEVTRVAFDVTPDGRSLIIDLLGQLWRVPSSGGDAVAITNAARDTAEDMDPAVSRDGRTIVFQSDRPGGRGLWLMTDDGAPRLLTSRYVGFFAHMAAAWAPDGQHIAYAVGDSLSVLDVMRGGETVVRIDSLPGGSALPAFTPRHGSPTWSPDGTQLTFVNAASGANRGEGRIFEVAVTGGQAHPVTTMRGIAPAWSPDGTRLAFFARDSTNRWQLYLQDRAEIARRLTSHDEVVTHRVRWMPDGQSLLYAADGRLWRVSPNGDAPRAIPIRARVAIPRRRVALEPIVFPKPGEERSAKGFVGIALSPDARRIAMIALDTLWVQEPGATPRAVAPARDAGDRALVWSPDGASLLWTRREGPTRSFDLVITAVGTGTTRVLASLGNDVSSPAWSADGRHIAFLAGGRLRVMNASAPAARAEARDLGVASSAWGTLAWAPTSDAIIVSRFDLNARRTIAEWIPLEGQRQSISRFPRAAADLQLSLDGQATWVEGNQLWRGRFDGPAGIQGDSVLLSVEPAVEARYATDGTVLYLSGSGLRMRSPNGSVRDVPWPLRYRVPTAPEPLLIRGARVVDGRGAPLTDPRDVLIEGGRITRIAAAGTLRAGAARVLDANGAYLIPGLIDLHAHIWNDLSLLSWLHNGVTTVRDVASQKLKTPDTRNAIAAGVRDGPRIVYGGAMFHRIGARYSTLADQMATDSASFARALAIMAGMEAGFVKERGFDKWWSVVRLVDEAQRHGLTVSGHCGHILPVVAAGVDGAEHVLDCFRDRYTVRSDYAALARASGMFIVPTAALRFSPLRVLDDPSLLTSPDVQPFLDPAYRSFYATDSVARRGARAVAAAVQRLESSIRRYIEAGVTVATGTDSPFPLGVQHEMEVLVASGLTPMQAIVAATGNAASVLHAKELGTIAEGQLADLVLLDANPLEDIRNTRRIRHVVQGGRVVDREKLRAAGIR